MGSNADSRKRSYSGSSGMGMGSITGNQTLLQIDGNSCVNPVRVCKYSANEIRVVHRRSSGGIENISPTISNVDVPSFLETTFIGSPLRQKRHSVSVPTNLHQLQQSSIPRRIVGNGSSTIAREMVDSNQIHPIPCIPIPGDQKSTPAPQCSCEGVQKKLAKAEAEVIILTRRSQSSDSELRTTRKELEEFKIHNQQLTSEVEKLRQVLTDLASIANSPVPNERKLAGLTVVRQPDESSGKSVSASIKSIDSSLERITSRVRRLSLGRWPESSSSNGSLTTSERSFDT